MRWRIIEIEGLKGVGIYTVDGKKIGEADSLEQALIIIQQITGETPKLRRMVEKRKGDKKIRFTTRTLQ